MRLLIVLLVILSLSCTAYSENNEKPKSLPQELNLNPHIHNSPIQGTVEGTKRFFNIEVDNSKVIPGEAASGCSMFELVNEAEFQFTGYSMVFEVKDVVESAFAFACRWNPSMKMKINCKYPPIGCDEMIFGWTGGEESYNYPPNVGFPTKNGQQYVLFIVNYSEQFVGGDGSIGMRLFYTETPRPDAIGFMSFGVGINAIRLQPQSKAEKVSGVCPNTCLKSYVEKPVTVLSSYFHMHSLGVNAKTEIKRGDKIIPLSYVTAPFPKHSMLGTVSNVKIEPGDEIITTCTYDTSKVTRVTNGGHAKNKEMCYNFVAYYPANPKIMSTFCGNIPGPAVGDSQTPGKEITHCFGIAGNGNKHSKLHLHLQGHADERNLDAVVPKPKPSNNRKFPAAAQSPRKAIQSRPPKNRGPKH